MQNKYLEKKIEAHYKQSQKPEAASRSQQDEHGSMELLYIAILLGFAAYLLWRLSQTSQESYLSELQEYDMVLTCDKDYKGMHCTPSYVRIIDGIRSLVPDVRSTIKFSREQTYYLIRASTIVERNEAPDDESENMTMRP